MVKGKTPKQLLSYYLNRWDLENIFKDADQAQKVSLYLKSDKPVKVDYKIGQANFKFYLAHMIL